jgi:hypothetical protein
MREPMPTTTRRALVPIALATGLCALILAGPAAAQVDPVAEADDQIVLSGRVDVPRGSTVGQIVVLRGSVNVQGVALGDVVVVSGRLTVSGQVGGSVVNLDGPVVLAGSAQVRGDVLSRQSVTVRRGAQVEGDVRENVPFSLRGPLGWFGGFAAWLAVTVSSLLLGLLLLWLLPRACDAIVAAARDAPLPSAGLGVGWLVVVPLAAIVAMLSLVALPLGLSALLAVPFALSVGHVWAAWLVGRLVLPDTGRPLAFLAGLGILRLVGLLPVVGGLVWVLGGAFGLGAATVALWRARGAGGRHRPGRARDRTLAPGSPDAAAPAEPGLAVPPEPM